MIQNWWALLPWMNRQRAYYECRRCGTTVDVATEECPMCGSAQIARYEIA